MALPQNPGFELSVLNEKSLPAVGATVQLFSNNKLLKTVVTNSEGVAFFDSPEKGFYSFSVTYTGYKSHNIDSVHFPSRLHSVTITLEPEATTMESVRVTTHKPPIQQMQGKTVVNVDASVTNLGATVLEVLEKSPGVMVDKNGSIALQGKSGVTVMIDDKPTFLSGAELNNLLSSMSSSQVDQIELITNPSAKYDASGNAGIINIKTKKNKTTGFNGTITISPGQGVYPKNTNSVVLNYRTGKFNTFVTYSFTANKYLTSIYALRKYYDDAGNLTAVLDQPTYFSGKFFNNTLKTGIDYFVTPKTTIGISLGGTTIQRKGESGARATWLDAAGNVDSAVSTTSTSNNDFKSGTINLNARHTFNQAQDISVDIDWLNYGMANQPLFNNELMQAGGYKEASQGDITSYIHIKSAKADYNLRSGENTTIQAGFKLSQINTDNTAYYENYDGTNWYEDYGKSNRFLYKENINAIYSSVETKYKKFNMQGGLRYEATVYDASQLGNAVQKDSSFSRNYGGLFPSGFVTYQADSLNGFTVTFGRRIDRPAFQTLNPFYFVINKYTYQTGNPFILPQYSWNLELSHQYKNILTTRISYSNIKNYFSQLFLTDTVSGILFYSQGNVGSVYNIGLSATIVISPFKWWSLTGQALYNHKQLNGYNGLDYTSQINQLNFNLNNQFSFAKVYSGEISGFYTTRARNDLQELLYPTGQLSVGVSRPVLKKKGTVKLSVRDIFYTNAMEGFTQFLKATEYFIVRRDSRVINIAFTYRFGKTFKAINRRASGAGDEMERVGNG